jgi:hypothetical protein
MRRFLLVPALLAVALAPALAAPAAPAPQPTRNEHLNNLKQIGLALHAYHDTNKKFPTAAIYSKDGKPLLSWRVAILPYIEQGNLYNLFKLDEPWDSEHNLKLLDKMPTTYGPIGNNKDDKTKTYYRVFTGANTVFEGTTGRRITDIIDGTSNTILVVEAHEGVPWTKPDDLPYDAKKALPRLGNHGDKGFAVLTCDGAVHIFRQDFDEQQMRNAITRNDGNPVEFEKLTK